MGKALDYTAILDAITLAGAQQFLQFSVERREIGDLLLDLVHLSPGELVDIRARLLFVVR